MATLTPSFEEYLTTLPTDKCQQALMWFQMNNQSEPIESEVLSSTLKHIESMNSFDSLALVSHLSTNEQVAYTIMNEFGAHIRHNSFFDTLVQQVQHRLQQLQTLKQLTDYSNN